MDKAYWQAIITNDYALPQDRPVEDLTPALLANLGSTDFELRDIFAYPILERWINKNVYSPAQLRTMIAQLAHNLTVGAGEAGTDSAFLRAFSALVLAEIVYYEHDHPFLEESEVRRLLDQAEKYFIAEQDLRGYVFGSGWVHAIAHGSDLLAVLAMHRYLNAPDLERILDALANKIAPPVTHIYLYNEDERMLRAVLFALKRNLLAASYMASWLERITHYNGHTVGLELLFEGESIVLTSEVNAYVVHNTKQFLDGLYFHLAHDEPQLPLAAELLPRLVESLKAMHNA